MILVTGATGLSGSIVMKEFGRQNISVRALVRNRQKAKFLENYKNIEVYEGDLLQPETFLAALEGVEKALLISSAFEDMVTAQQNFIDTAKRAGLRHVIKYSGQDSGIGFNSQNFIAAKQHENLEDYLVDSGLDWTIIRPSQFMEMYLPGAPTGINLEKDALVLAIKSGKLSPVAIEDVAKVCVRVLTETGHENMIYEMTGPDALNMYEACEIISDAVGRKISYINLSLDEYLKALRAAGLPEQRTQIVMQISKERAKCIESHVKLDTHKRFGIRPTNFAEFIYKNVAAFERKDKQLAA